MKNVHKNLHLLDQMPVLAASLIVKRDKISIRSSSGNLLITSSILFSFLFFSIFTTEAKSIKHAIGAHNFSWKLTLFYKKAKNLGNFITKEKRITLLKGKFYAPHFKSSSSSSSSSISCPIIRRFKVALSSMKFIITAFATCKAIKIHFHAHFLNIHH